MLPFGDYSKHNIAKKSLVYEVPKVSGTLEEAKPFWPTPVEGPYHHIEAAAEWCSYKGAGDLITRYEF